MELVVHTDGGSRGNPGPSAVGIVIKSSSTPLLSLGLYLGHGTNNNAEYMAVITALKWITANAHNAARIAFFLDSQLVVSQLNGIYAVKHPDMRRLKNEVENLRHTLPAPVTFTYVPRADNAEADALVNQCLDANALS